MNLASAICRVLLGLMFLVFGLNGFLMFIPQPHLTGIVVDFTRAMAVSHFLYFTSGVQVICGVLLLINRFVPLALVTLAAVIANILAFHFTVYPQGFPPAIIVTILWVIAALRYRSNFAPLLTPKT